MAASYLCKPIKILVPIDLQFPRDYDLLTAGYLSALSPFNLKDTPFNTTDFQVDRIEYNSDILAETIVKIGWACRSGEYQAVLANTMSRDAKIYGLLCSHYKIPTVSLDSAANILADKNRYPTFFRYATSLEAQAHTSFLILQELGWKNLVLVVADDNPLWNEAAVSIQTIAATYNINILSELILPGFEGLDPIRDYKKVINQIRFSQGRVIYVIGNQLPTLDFVLAAQYHGLSRNQYSFLLYNDVSFPDNSDKVDYWAQQGVELGIASRKGLFAFNFLYDQEAIQKWHTEHFLPNLESVKQGPYYNVDVYQSGNDPSMYFPQVFYDSPSSLIPSNGVISSYDSIKRFIFAWQSVIKIDIDELDSH